MSDAEFMREASGLAAKDAEIDRLESQNQALQEELATTQRLGDALAVAVAEELDGWKATAQANVAMVTNYQAAVQALQERAEKAEAALHAIFDDAGSGVDLDIGYIDIGLSGQQMKTIRTALSPTQETGPG